MSNAWEKIDSTTERLKVPGGWLVRSWRTEVCNGIATAIHQTFIADPDWTWRL